MMPKTVAVIKVDMARLAIAVDGDEGRRQVDADDFGDDADDHVSGDEDVVDDDVCSQHNDADDGSNNDGRHDECGGCRRRR